MTEAPTNLQKRIEGLKSISSHQVWYEYIVFLEDDLIEMINPSLILEFHDIVMNIFDDLSSLPIAKKIDSLFDFTLNRLKNYLTLIPEDQLEKIEKLFFARCNVIINSLQRTIIKHLKESLKCTPDLPETTLKSQKEIENTTRDWLEFSNQFFNRTYLFKDRNKTPFNKIMESISNDFTEMEDWFSRIISVLK